MIIKFETIRDFISTIPQGSATNELILWVNRKGLTSAILEISKTEKKTTYATDFSKEAFLHTAARTVTAAFAMPALKGVGMLYNTTAACLKLGVGVVAHMRNPEDLKVKKELCSGIEHLLTVIYDLVIGIFSTLFALAYGLVPNLVIQVHEKDFLKQGADAIIKWILPEQQQKGRFSWRK